MEHVCPYFKVENKRDISNHRLIFSPPSPLTSEERENGVTGHGQVLVDRAFYRTMG